MYKGQGEALHVGTRLIVLAENRSDDQEILHSASQMTLLRTYFILLHSGHTITITNTLYSLRHEAYITNSARFFYLQLITNQYGILDVILQIHSHAHTSLFIKVFQLYASGRRDIRDKSICREAFKKINKLN